MSERKRRNVILVAIFGAVVCIANIGIRVAMAQEQVVPGGCSGSCVDVYDCAKGCMCFASGNNGTCK